jgi:PIN domain nuclease of toxin-antitoxin system
MNGNPELESSPALPLAERASEHGGLLLCSISLFEITTYARSGRISPAIPIRDWIADALETPGLRLLPIDAALAAEAAALPGTVPADGVDRLIVAAARLSRAALVTADPALIAYGAEGHVRVVEV